MKRPFVQECINCQKSFTLLVEPADFDRWRAGELIQNAMPYLSAEERELLISQICGECFEKIAEEE